MACRVWTLIEAVVVGCFLSCEVLAIGVALLVGELGSGGDIRNSLPVQLWDAWHGMARLEYWSAEHIDDSNLAQLRQA